MAHDQVEDFMTKVASADAARLIVKNDPSPT